MFSYTKQVLSDEVIHYIPKRSNKNDTWGGEDYQRICPSCWPLKDFYILLVVARTLKKQLVEEETPGAYNVDNSPHKVCLQVICTTFLVWKPSTSTERIININLIGDEKTRDKIMRSHSLVFTPTHFVWEQVPSFSFFFFSIEPMFRWRRYECNGMLKCSAGGKMNVMGC